MKSKVILMVVLLGVVLSFAFVVMPKVVPHKSTAERKVKVNRKPKKVTRATERKFDIEIVQVEESGALSRIITARLINKDGYTKNVVVTLELFVDGDRIKVNGKDKLVIKVGDMKPNSSVEKKVEISVGFFDGLRIKSKGYVDAKLTISWNGGREVFKKRIRV